MMTLNSKKKIVAFGEIMLRLTPPDYTTISQAKNFIANYIMKVKIGIDRR